MRLPQSVFFALGLLLLTPVSGHGAPVTITVEQELRHGGNNYDDPCFWQDPTNAAHSLACITSKNDDVVECFNLPSGDFVGFASGFRGVANNCDVDADRDELVTTDNAGNRILVHRLPDLGGPARVLDDPNFSDVTGVCVGHRGGQSLVFATDEARLKVFVLDSLTGQRITSFSHGLTKAEGIACDDGNQRVYVCDDQSDNHSCRAFTFDGEFLPPEFGIDQTNTDSEGVTVYECGPTEGYIIVSDQKDSEFEVFDRSEPFNHRCTFRMELNGDRTNATDGIDVVQIPAYPNGIFGACDGCGGRTDELDLVSWQRIAEACGLRVCPLGQAPGGGPTCGDGVVNRSTEECDGTDDRLCPGACQTNCLCPTTPEPPRASCGDGVLNQSVEECDGTDDRLCPGTCQTNCLCPTPPEPPRASCGDGRINQLTEQCDASDDDHCPGRCQSDCRCAPAQELARASVIADAFTRRRSRDRNYNRSRLIADRRSPKRSYLKIHTEGIGNRAVVSALLHLTVANTRRSKSNHGGTVYATSCDWTETGITWRNAPATVGIAIDERPGRVVAGDVVTFDLTGFIAGDADHCVAITSPSSDSVQYASREMATGPFVTLDLAGSVTPACGDGVVNQLSEACDGADDSACPGSCRSDCRCAAAPRCGDDQVNQTTEECDGSADTRCPGQCQPDCTCPLDPPVPTGTTGPTDGDTFGCLASGSDVVLSGVLRDEYRTRSIKAGAVIDAREATFIHCSQSDPSKPCRQNIYPVNLGPTSGGGVCWAGGVISGANRLDATWHDMHSPNNAGFIFENPDFTIDGIRMHNVGDGIRPRGGARNFTIKNVWLSHVRDDCIENDHMNGGLVDDSLFDGCYVGFSARHPSSSVAGPDNLWTIQNSLVRLEPTPGSRDSGGLGHKGFFKWNSWGDPNSRSPRIALYNNIFMAEQTGDFSADRMGIPPGKLADCANNVMVWLGPGDYPASLPSCFTIVKDASVWNDARSEWIARHPGVRSR